PLHAEHLWNPIGPDDHERSRLDRKGTSGTSSVDVAIPPLALTRHVGASSSKTHRQPTERHEMAVAERKWFAHEGAGARDLFELRHEIVEQGLQIHGGSVLASARRQRGLLSRGIENDKGSQPLEEFALDPANSHQLLQALEAPTKLRAKL